MYTFVTCTCSWCACRCSTASRGDSLSSGKWSPLAHTPAAPAAEAEGLSDAEAPEEDEQRPAHRSQKRKNTAVTNRSLIDSKSCSCRCRCRCMCTCACMRAYTWTCTFHRALIEHRQQLMSTTRPLMPLIKHIAINNRPLMQRMEHSTTANIPLIDH